MTDKERAEKLGSAISPLSGREEKTMGQMAHQFEASWNVVNLPMEIKNAFEHYVYVHENGQPPLLKDDAKKNHGPAIIIGSGESLSKEAFEAMKEWEGAIFCSSSHISTFAYHDIVPDYFTVLDPRWNETELEQVPADWMEKAKDKCTYIATPVAPPGYTKQWPGRLRWCRIMDPGSQWYSVVVKNAFPWIVEELLPYAANVPALLGIAQFLGYSPIFLVGADFGNHRFDCMRWKDGAWEKDIGGFQPEEYTVINQTGQVTTPNLMWAKRGCLCVMRINTPMLRGKTWEVYNSSEYTALNELPYVSLRRVVECQGRGIKHPWTKKKFVELLDRGLALYDTLVIEMHNGLSYGSRVYFAHNTDEVKHVVDSINREFDTVINGFGELSEEQRATARKNGFKIEKAVRLNADEILKRYLKAREDAVREPK